MRQQAAAAVLALSAPAASLSSGSEQPWTSPRETDYAKMAEQQLEMGTTPRPTPAPLPRGLFGRMELVPRLEGYTLGPATCGFVQSNGNSFTCIANTLTCASLNGYLGCCQPNQECSRIQTVCIDFAASKAGKCELLSDFHTVCCSSAAPACYTYLMTRSGSGYGEGTTQTALGCYSTSGSAVLLDYDPKWSKTHSFSPSSASSGSESASTASTSPAESATETGNGGGGGGGGTNVAAIAGGVAGGVVGLALIGAVVFLLLRRRRQGPDSANSSSQAAMVQNPPPHDTQSYSPAPQGYDPHMSAYNPQPYPPQGGYPQHYPPQHYPQGQYGQQPGAGYAQYGGAAGYAASSTVSPQTTPSPNLGKDSVHAASPPPAHAAAPHQPPPSELAAVAPLGNEGNRAELS
ncbi:hypothetical protein CDD83_7395 [Cordyceps sp. RAO-2017]|nr:hypothetical protein CDD83_7395 [Cordyceps sp. RAO-2017]